VAEIFRTEAVEAVEAAATALAAGGVVVFPTDTVFGIAANPTVTGATGRIFAAKRRSREVTLPVLVAGLDQARDVAALDARAEALAARYWPGPLTLVLARSESSRRWELGEERATVGVRVPDHPVALAILRRTGPLAVTSANVSGEPTPVDLDGVLVSLGDHLAVAVGWGPAPRGRASTVVDLTGPVARLVREGEISAADIEAVAKGAPEGLG